MTQKHIANGTLQPFSAKGPLLLACAAWRKPIRTSLQASAAAAFHNTLIECPAGIRGFGLTLSGTLTPPRTQGPLLLACADKRKAIRTSL